MRHLAFDLKGTNSYNRVTTKVVPQASDGTTGRVIDTGLGIFFTGNVDIKYNNSSLVEGLDYVITGYSKHFKHNYNLDASGLIVLLTQVDYELLEITANYVGGGYTLYRNASIPKTVPILGNGVAQILWDNVVEGVCVDPRLLNGEYPAEIKTPSYALGNLLGAYAEQARSSGVPEDKTAIRAIVRNLSLGKLGKVPGGLNTEDFTVVGAINDIKRQLDEVQTTTVYLGTLLKSTAIVTTELAVKSGWVVGADNLVITGYFKDGISSVVAMAGDTITYIPEGMYLIHETDSTDYKLVKEAWFSDLLPNGVKNLLNAPLTQLQNRVLKLPPWHLPFGGFISPTRNNTTIPRNLTSSNGWIVSDEDTTVTYWDGVKWAAVNADIGDFFWWSHVSGVCTRLVNLRLGREPLYDNGVDTIARINALKESIDTTGLTRGSVLETFRAVDPMFAIPLGSVPVSRITYRELFEVIGTTYGEGDGSTTFGVPSASYGSYRGVIGTTRPNGTAVVANSRVIPHPTDLGSVFSVPMGVSGSLVEVDTTTGVCMTRELDLGITGGCLSADTGLIYIVSDTADTLVSYNPNNGQVLELATGIDASIKQIFRLGADDYLLLGDSMWRYYNSTVSLIGALPLSGSVGGVIGLTNADHFVMAIEGKLYKVSRVTGVNVVLPVLESTGLWINLQTVSGKISVYDSKTGNIHSLGIDLSGQAVLEGNVVAGLVGWLPKKTSNLEWVSTDHLGLLRVEKEPAIPRYVVARAEG